MVDRHRGRLGRHAIATIAGVQVAAGSGVKRPVLLKRAQRRNGGAGPVGVTGGSHFRRGAQAVIGLDDLHAAGGAGARAVTVASIDGEAVCGEAHQGHGAIALANARHMALGNAVVVVIAVHQRRRARHRGLVVRVARVQAHVLVQVFTRHLVGVGRAGVGLGCAWLQQHAVVGVVVRHELTTVNPGSIRKRVVGVLAGAQGTGVGVAASSVVTIGAHGVRRRDSAAVGHGLAHHLGANFVGVAREIG